jgi:hypothetical protein
LANPNATLGRMAQKLASSLGLIPTSVRFSADFADLSIIRFCNKLLMLYPAPGRGILIAMVFADGGFYDESEAQADTRVGIAIRTGRPSFHLNHTLP